MVEIDILYEGQLRCTAKHGPSATTLSTDAPLDNHGRGESFSPTDLLAAALGTCMTTVMGILAQKRGWSIDGMRVHVEKHMTSTLPRRVARLVVRADMAGGAALSEEERGELEHAANTCPVRLSLLDAIEVPVDFRW